MIVCLNSSGDQQGPGNLRVAEQRQAAVRWLHKVADEGGARASNLLVQAAVRGDGGPGRLAGGDPAR